jgi:DNA-binding CsgD family transcriptional regulator
MRLTPREREIATLIANSQSDKEIAARLRISWHTVRNHIKTIYRKMDVRKPARVAAFRTILLEDEASCTR